MARISVWFVRAALVHFLLGATVGAWGLAAKSGLWPAFPLSVVPLHVEGMLIGWICQLAIGVALWIFPFSGSVSRDRRLWVAWVLLNGGILLVAGSKIGGFPVVHLLGRVGEAIAAGLVAWSLWPRLRRLPRRTHQ